MSDIVKVKNKECFIDSEGISVLSENEHRAVSQLIRSHMSDLEEFGVMTFEMSKPNEIGGRPKKLYQLNEQQATLLTTFMKNSKKVKEFKKKLVREFFRMREYIQKQETHRLAGIESRKKLTDTIKESGEQERMHGHGYSTYTKLAYTLIGVTSDHRQFKSDQKIIDGYKKLKFRDILNPDQVKKLDSAETMIKSLIELEMEYGKIKETLKPLFDKKEIG